MLHASNSLKPKTVGPGRNGVTDKILHGTDGRHVTDNSSNPPSLQDVVFRSLLHQYIRISLVDGNVIQGKLMWYNQGKLGIRPDRSEVIVMCCNRVLGMAPCALDKDSVPFVAESIRENLIQQEERSSKQFIVKRRMQERNNRNAASRDYNNPHRSMPP